MPPEAPAAMPLAVLWDMDGTLVDTEPSWIEAEYALVARHGGDWNDDHAHALVGNALIVSARYIREHGGVDLAPEAIVEQLLDGVVARVREHVPWRPGARDLLAALGRARVPCALVTMSYRRLADAVVAHLPAGTFAAVVTGDEVHRGKPDPEPYLAAAGRLGFRPRDCLAIEDSPAGVASARAAGVPVLGVRHLVELTAAPGVHLIDSLTDVDLAALARLHGALLAA